MPLGRNGTVDATRFLVQPRGDIPRSRFSNRHFHKSTFLESTLVPVYIDEVLPGDVHRLEMTCLARLATPIVPVMDNLILESYFFFVPCRLVWSNWQAFMGEQDNETAPTTYLTPYITVLSGEMGVGTIWDYFGIRNNGSGNNMQVAAMPLRAYNLIWNQWFRAQQFQSSLSVPTGDGPDVSIQYSLQPVNKYHDYFTSALPWPEQPSPDTRPGGTLEPLAPGQSFFMGSGKSGAPLVGLGVPNGTLPNAGVFSEQWTGSRLVSSSSHFDSSMVPFTMSVTSGNYPNVRVLVSDMRTAMQVQALIERDARGGTRYVEKVFSHFGVRSPDARLQRPEFLGGGRSVITVNPVAQTSASGATGTTTKLGQLAAAAFVAAKNHGFHQAFTEHGYVLGFVCVRSMQTYQQGLNRLWSRRSQFDFYWPSLAHLSEQPILSQEVYSDGSANDLNIFGYAPRWEEYRWKESRTSGYFNSSAATPLDMWHYAEYYSVRPSLNTGFLVDATPLARVMQVSAPYTSHIMSDMMFDVDRTRPLPMFSIPGTGARL